mmetsp:Transcript_22791/g.34840  ORF Transcript_22791/g.34840 Transcript_22791/m.34840 type:complete len:102 (+) Transcript_22791:1620-1925(+)
MFVISLGTSAKVWLGKCYKKFSASDGIESINKNWKAGPILTSNTALDGAERIKNSCEVCKATLFSPRNGLRDRNVFRLRRDKQRLNQLVACHYSRINPREM